MPNPIDNLVDSGEPVDVIAGALLEHLVKTNPNAREGGMFTSSIAASMVGESAGGAPSKRMLKVLEAFEWLRNRDMLAGSTQQGMVFVTDKGKDIGTAASLKTYLEQQRGGTEAAYEAAVKELGEMKARTEADVAEMKKRASSDIAKAVADAKVEADQILNLARKTAEGVSLNDVQKQFAQAAGHCLTNAYLWGSLSFIFCAALGIAVIGFFTRWQPSFQTPAQAGAVTSAFAIYHTVLRVTLLAAIAGLATFCLKILRAQLHLREQNLHRQRVANSMAAFLGATTSPEQRDLILGRLADAITVFGNSGLLSDDDSMSPAKVILESVQRGLASK